MRTEGWASGLGSKYHYIREGRSLCRRWLWIASNDLLDDDTGTTNKGDCKTCARLMERERNPKMCEYTPCGEKATVVESSEGRLFNVCVPHRRLMNKQKRMNNNV